MPVLSVLHHEDEVRHVVALVLAQLTEVKQQRNKNFRIILGIPSTIENLKTPDP